MPRLLAPHWNEKDGVCTRHMLPRIPCPLCAMEKNQDVEVRFDEIDLDVSAAEKRPLKDLLPADFAYLGEREGNYIVPDEVPEAQAASDESFSDSSWMWEMNQ